MLRRPVGGPLSGHRPLWENAWAEFVPFLSFELEIREVIYTTNAIESINARIRKAVKARDHFSTERRRSCVCTWALMSLVPTGKGCQRWSNRWKPAPRRPFHACILPPAQPRHRR